MDPRPVRTARGGLRETFDAPPSKSATHRALVAAALADGPSAIVRPLDARDTCATRAGLEALGVRIESQPDRWIVSGCGSAVNGGGEIALGESGTSMRFLLAVAALGQRRSRLDGDPRLRERPLVDLVEALRSLGARVDVSPSISGLPLSAGGRELSGGKVTLPAGPSSQYASALLLVGSRLPGGIDLELAPPVVSLPYVEMTADVLSGFGAAIERPSTLRWSVGPKIYPGREWIVEGDHSSASYLLAAAAVVGGRVGVRGLDPASRQPDAVLGRLLARLGCRVETSEDGVEVEGEGRLPGFEADLTDSPDLAPTVAVLALFSEGPCRLTGVAHLRHKESDRLEMLAANLRALGRSARARDSRLEIAAPSGPLHGARVETASDHRLAMAFAIAGLRAPGIVIDDAACVAKSNPGFWTQFERLEGRP